MSYLDPDEVAALGLRHVGLEVRISRRAAIHGAERISIGDRTRIDDFCVLSAGEGGIHIGRHVHLAVMCSLIGKGAIRIGDYSNLSSRVAIYSSSDDFSGEYMTNPTVASELTHVTFSPVTLARHCIVGAGSVLLPGTTMETGAALGALSLGKGRLAEFSIYGGVPARKLKERRRSLLDLERKMRAFP